MEEKERTICEFISEHLFIVLINNRQQTPMKSLQCLFIFINHVVKGKITLKKFFCLSEYYLMQVNCKSEKNYCQAFTFT